MSTKYTLKPKFLTISSVRAPGKYVQYVMYNAYLHKGLTFALAYSLRIIAQLSSSSP